jgi:pyruvate/2-oxoglutarate dehydrogenase complex dihydrolipoamide dehydrogenase (E3) component
MTIECDCILNATGRVPNVFDLGLEKVISTR